MKRIGLLASVGLISLGLSGCERDSESSIEKRLDKIEARLAKIETGTKAGASTPALAVV